jgi:predicted dehydrogenase
MMINFGVIGTGWIAEEFVKGANLVEGFNFAAVYSRTYEKGKAFASQFKDVPVYTDIDEFAESNIDAVYIASPNFLHYKQSKLMLENGKHVLCEKPITITPDEFEELFSIAKSKKLVYTEAIMFLHIPARETVKEAIKSIGNVTTAHFDFSQLSSKYAALKRGENPNIFNPKMQTGCLRDLGIYCFYPAVDFFGIPDKIISSALFVSTGADGSGTTILKYPDKQITLTYSKTGQDYCGSQIVGDIGTLTFGSISKLTDVNIYYDDEEKKHQILGEVEKHILMSYEAKNFFKYITEYEKFFDEYFKKNQTIFNVNKLIFEVKNQCKIV